MPFVVRARVVRKPFRLLAFGLGIALGASGVAAPRSDPRPSAEPAAPTDGGPFDPPSASVRTALERALSEPEALRSAHLFLECTRDGALPALELYGRGFGIWDDKRQFAWSTERMSAALAALRTGGFAELAPRYGGRAKSTEPGALDEDENAAVKVLCRIRLEIDPIAKEVVQLDEGEQSETLRKLADSLYGLASEPARSGIEAASLEDGLTRLAAGQLAPETLTLSLLRKPELIAGAGSRPGFLLGVEGRRATAQPFDAETSFGAGRTLELAPGELAELASALGRLRPSLFPVNLWAPDYNDLRVELLGHSVSVQARGFSRMSPTTHGESQRNFDAFAELLARLAERVLRDGLPRAGE